MTVRTSTVNATPIDESYPVAGIDNDTQGFRDNFQYIKTALGNTKTELELLLNNTAGLQLSEVTNGATSTGSNFNNRVIAGAVFKENQHSLNNYGTGSGVDGVIYINFGNADYQIYRLDADVEFRFEGVSADNVNKVTLELLSDGGTYNVTFSTNGDYPIKKNASFPGSLTVSSSSNPVMIDVLTRAKSEDPGVLGRTYFLNYLGQFS